MINKTNEEAKQVKTYLKIKAILETVENRFSANIAKNFKKPSKTRNVVSKPIDAIINLTGASNDIIKNYLDDLNNHNLLDLIDQNLSRNIPEARYNKIRNFKNNNEWIEILTSLYVLVRLLKPKNIVETGVGEIGMSSSYILCALIDNEYGELWSIDPDKFYQIYGYHIGAGIPDSLISKHKLVIGTSQKKLKPLLNQLENVDIFLHDGDHRYNTKLYEYDLAYKHSNNGSFILSDDTWDSAFDLFLENHNGLSYSVKYGKSDFFSFFRKKR
jgi:predicted O-methyltransferase YrrM